MPSKRHCAPPLSDFSIEFGVAEEPTETLLLFLRAFHQIYPIAKGTFHPSQAVVHCICRRFLLSLEFISNIMSCTTLDSSQWKETSRARRIAVGLKETQLLNDTSSIFVGLHSFTLNNHAQIGLSHVKAVHPDELDEEFDTFDRIIWIVV